MLETKRYFCADCGASVVAASKPEHCPECGVIGQMTPAPELCAFRIPRAARLVLERAA